MQVKNIDMYDILISNKYNIKLYLKEKLLIKLCFCLSGGDRTSCFGQELTLVADEEAARRAARVVNRRAQRVDPALGGQEGAQVQLINGEGR
jgi:hypothetical protein